MIFLKQKNRFNKIFSPLKKEEKLGCSLSAPFSGFFRFRASRQAHPNRLLTNLFFAQYYYIVTLMSLFPQSTISAKNFS